MRGKVFKASVTYAGYNVRSMAVGGFCGTLLPSCMIDRRLLTGMRRKGTFGKGPSVSSIPRRLLRDHIPTTITFQYDERDVAGKKGGGHACLGVLLKPPEICGVQHRQHLSFGEAIEIKGSSRSRV